jgi:transposase
MQGKAVIRIRKGGISPRHRLDWSPCLSLKRLFPHLSGLRVERIVIEGSRVFLHLGVERQFARCPLCHRRSERRHSRYFRTLADLPVASYAIQLRVAVRRFRCVNPLCRRRIFAERLPRLAADYARRTHDQRAALTDLGFALGGSAGARLAGRMRLTGSRATLLRLVHAAPPPNFPTPRVLGVDDWAWRRGRKYGSILVDLEEHRTIDLLPDRTAATFADWLKRHPGIEIISRDRGGAYADGARQGAPNAVQVADRFHILVNIGEALERVLARHHTALREAAAAVDRAMARAWDSRGEEPARAAEESAAKTRLTRAEQTKQARRASREARYEAAVGMYRQGHSLHAIARRLTIGRATVRRFLHAGAFPERATPPPRPSILAPFEPYLRERWAEGCHNARVLWREIQGRGFPGRPALVRRYVARWRATPGRRGPTPRRAESQGQAPSPPVRPPTRVLSPRQARWLLLRPADELRAGEQDYRSYLLTGNAEIQDAQALAQDFGRLIRARDREALAPWLVRAESGDLPEMRGFAIRLRRDLAAVEAALTFEWSNGPVEGEINKLKALKRQMYGRAGFDLLHKRLVQAA